MVPNANSRIPSQLMRVVSTADRPLLLVCAKQTQVDRLVEDSGNQRVEGWLTVELPCLARVGEELLAAAALRAKHAIAVSGIGCESCVVDQTVQPIEERFKAAYSLLIRNQKIEAANRLLLLTGETLSSKPTQQVKNISKGKRPGLLGRWFSNPRLDRISAGPTRRELIHGLRAGQETYVNQQAVSTERGALLAACPDIEFNHPIVTGQCSGCKACTKVCETNALELKESNRENIKVLFVEPEKCISCAKCVEICPEKCLQLSEYGKPGKKPIGESRLNRCIKCNIFLHPGESDICQKCQAGNDFLDQVKSFYF